MTTSWTTDFVVCLGLMSFADFLSQQQQQRLNQRFEVVLLLATCHRPLGVMQCEKKGGVDMVARTSQGNKTCCKSSTSRAKLASLYQKGDTLSVRVFESCSVLSDLNGLSLSRVHLRSREAITKKGRRENKWCKQVFLFFKHK